MSRFRIRKPIKIEGSNKSGNNKSDGDNSEKSGSKAQNQKQAENALGMNPKPEPNSYNMDDFDADPVEKSSDPADCPISNESLERCFANSSDLVRRDIYVNNDPNWPASLYVIDGMVNYDAVSQNILRPLLQEKELTLAENLSDLMDMIQRGMVYSAYVKTCENLNILADDMISGSAALIFPSSSVALSFEVKGFERRGVGEPQSESVSKGSLSSFTETIRTNTAMVRRKIGTPDLRFLNLTIGRRTKTNVVVCYIEGLTNPQLVSETMKRLNAIDTDSAISVAQINDYFFEGTVASTFPKSLSTERPDRFASFILEGRVGFFIDELPVGIVVPATLGILLEAPEDYAGNPSNASMATVMRYVSLLITLLLPGVYTAMTSFHTEMLPTDLALAIISSKQGVPFPTFAETIIVLLSFELLLEANMRIPKSIGGTISIVGALIIGQAAVEAKIVSPMVIILAALTIITSFVMPNQDFHNALRPWRIAFVIAGTLYGLFGLSLLFYFLLFKLCRMEILGVPYLMPLGSKSFKETFIDGVLRMKLKYRKLRPQELNTEDARRQK